jgi:hypothetical protein
MPSGALQMVEFPEQMASLPPEIKQAGCPLTELLRALISQQKIMSNNFILITLKDMLLATIPVLEIKSMQR